MCDKFHYRCLMCYTPHDVLSEKSHYVLPGLKLFLLNIVVVVVIYSKNSVIERVSMSVQILLPVKINT